MEKVILYSLPSCPHCSEVKRILKEKNLIYDEITDIELMRRKKFLEVPMLEIGNTIMNYEETLNWLKNGFFEVSKDD